MKKTAVCRLVWLCVLFCCFALPLQAAQTAPERAPVTDFSGEEYALGDTLPNFNLQLLDGTLCTLDELLAQGKPVVLHFWASWCPDCTEELPTYYTVASRYGDRVSFVCLGVKDDPDDGQACLAEYGCQTLMAATDELCLYRALGIHEIPSTAVIDRFGKLCYIHQDGIATPEIYEQVLQPYLAADYDQTVLTETTPLVAYTGSTPDPRTVTDALCPNGWEGSAFTTPTGDWPFTPGQNGVTASNAGVPDSRARLTARLSAQKGDIFAVDYQLQGAEFTEYLTLLVDGEPVRQLSGNDAGTAAYTFDEAGEYTVELQYTLPEARQTGQPSATVSCARLLTGKAAKDFAKTLQKPVQSLTGQQLQCDILTPGSRVLTVTDRDGNPDDTAVQEGIIWVYVPADRARFRISIGDGVSPDLWYLQDSETGTYYRLNNTTADRKGYTVKLSLAAGGYFYRQFVCGASQGETPKTVYRIVTDPAAFQEIAAYTAGCQTGAKAEDYTVSYAEGSASYALWPVLAGCFAAGLGGWLALRRKKRQAPPEPLPPVTADNP